jgi:hypothetical protein
MEMDSFTQSSKRFDICAFSEESRLATCMTNCILAGNETHASTMEVSAYAAGCRV